MIEQSRQKRAAVEHVALRSPVWLHTRVLLAAMIELECARSDKAVATEPGGPPIRSCSTRVKSRSVFSLVQLAEGCDQFTHSAPRCWMPPARTTCNEEG